MCMSYPGMGLSAGALGCMGTFGTVGLYAGGGIGGGGGTGIIGGAVGIVEAGSNGGF